MQNKHYIIINPTSGKGFAKRHKTDLLLKLKQLKTDYEFVFTEYKKHEIKLVQQAIKNGFRQFISIGGDGTLHHIINGILLQTAVPSVEIQIGVIPLGTGNDWVKQYGIPNDIEKAITIINKNKIVPQDIGKIIFENEASFFNNAAGIGFDGFVVNSHEKYKRFGVASYLIASLMGLLKYKKSTLEFQFNNTKVNSKILLTTIGICSFSGGGMRFTTNVNPNDGLFDITLVKDIRILSFIWNIGKMYNGKLHEHKKVSVEKTSEISIKIIEGIKPFIQADGELIGQGDFSVKIIPNAINFVV